QMAHRSDVPECPRSMFSMAHYHVLGHGHVTALSLTTHVRGRQKKLPCRRRQRATTSLSPYRQAYKEHPMTTGQIASRLAELCRQGQFEAAQKELFAENAVSIEPEATADVPKETKGLRAIVDKGHKFESMVEKVHSCSTSAPLVAGNAIAFTLT